MEGGVVSLTLKLHNPEVKAAEAVLWFFTPVLSRCLWGRVRQGVAHNHLQAPEDSASSTGAGGNTDTYRTECSIQKNCCFFAYKYSKKKKKKLHQLNMSALFPVVCSYREKACEHLILKQEGEGFFQPYQLMRTLGGDAPDAVPAIQQQSSKAFLVTTHGELVLRTGLIKSESTRYRQKKNKQTNLRNSEKKSFSLQRLRKCIQGAGSHVPLLGWAILCNRALPHPARSQQRFTQAVKQSSNHPAAPPVTEAMLAPKETQVTTKSTQLDEHFMVKK